jgi:porin-like protein
MKMVKSLLLGSAAGLVAIAGAQAADLPVKAKPVQYVKICSLYGAGFYYIPGTDMCLKVGGWVRLEIGQHYNGSLTTGPMAGDVNNRTTNDEVWRSRGYITADARNQTEYGTLRSYIAVGLNSNDISNGEVLFNANRAFIQIAGFTLGLSTSFYDFYSSPATAFFGSYPGSDTGDGGWKVLAYTAQFGNGFSATLSAEVARRTTIINTSAVNPFPLGAQIASSYEGFSYPDVVGNLRVDQAWGSAQIMAALHGVGATYYTSAFPTEAGGHPDDELGYALGAGIKLNAPMIGKGDYLQAMFSYTHGASRYNFMNPNFSHFLRDGGTFAGGIMSDAVYGGTLAAATASDLELTDTWVVNAAYEHIWVPGRWKTSLYGGYASVMYGDRANAMLCSAMGLGQGAGGGTAAVATPGCDTDWQVWWIGTRTQWNVTKDFYIGLDVIYQKLEGMDFAPTAAVSPAAFAFAGQSFQAAPGSQDNIGFRFRAHRDFYP